MGEKRIHETDNNIIAKDGFEHNKNIFLAKYNFKGERLWEKIYDLKRTTNAPVIKEINNKFILIFSTSNFHKEKKLLFNSVHLYQVDTLGNIQIENHIGNVNFFNSNKIVWANDYFYLPYIADGVASAKKYSYDFKSQGGLAKEKAEIILNRENTFFKKSIVSISNIIDTTNSIKINNVSYKNSDNVYNFKLFDSSFKILKSIDITLKSEKYCGIKYVNYNDQLVYFATSNFLYYRKLSVKRKETLFCFDVVNQKIEKITDSLVGTPEYLFMINSSEFVYVHLNKVIYQIDGKLLSNINLEKFTGALYSSNSIFLISKNIIKIYKINEISGALKIYDYDYKIGKILN